MFQKKGKTPKEGKTPFRYKTLAKSSQMLAKHSKTVAKS